MKRGVPKRKNSKETKTGQETLCTTDFWRIYSKKSNLEDDAPASCRSREYVRQTIHTIEKVLHCPGESRWLVENNRAVYCASELVQNGRGNVMRQLRQREALLGMNTTA